MKKKTGFLEAFDATTKEVVAKCVADILNDVKPKKIKLDDFADLVAECLGEFLWQGRVSHDCHVQRDDRNRLQVRLTNGQTFDIRIKKVK